EWRRGDQKKISPERLGQYASASHASVTRGPRPLIPPLPTAHRPNKKDFANESCQMGAAQAKCVGFRSSGCDSYRRGLGRYVGPSEDSFFCRLSAPTAPRLATTCHLFLDRIRTPGGYGVFCAEWIPNSTTVIKNHFSGTWSWREYAINRSTRLYVVLIPGLLLGSLWDIAGSSLFAPAGVYTHPLSDLGLAIATNSLTIANFLGNLFFL